MQLVNTAILKSPINWVTVFLMLFIFGAAAHFILAHVSQNPLQEITN